MSFSLHFVLCSAICFLVIHLTTLHALHTKCHVSTGVVIPASVGNSWYASVKLQTHVFQVQVFKFYTMPVVTRSMQKNRLNSNIPITSDTDLFSSMQTTHMATNISTILSSTVPSSLPHLRDPSFSSFESSFEISNNSNLEFSELCHSCTPVPTSPTSQFCRMESECNKTHSAMKVDPDPHDVSGSSDHDIVQMLLAISNQMMANTQNLQDQILRHHQELQDRIAQTDLKLSTEIQNLTQDYEMFKQQSRAALISLQSLPLPTSVPPMSTTVANSSSAVGVFPVGVNSSLPSSTSIPIPTTSTLPSVSSVPTSTDTSQVQMMQLLTDTFSKLSTVLQESKNVSKSEWPKFSGEASKFKDWYLAIMAQLSLPPWSSLYDNVRNDIVSTTSDSQLNGQLYAKLLVCLEGQALKNMLSRKHIRANGLMLLQELHHMYRPKNVPEVIAAKTAEFWSKMKRGPSETIDSYYNRFHELLDDINDFRESVTKEDAIRQFIFTLGSDFESIQNSYRINNLPSAWKTDDWPTLLILCRDYYNSIHPNGPPAKKDSHLSDNVFASKQDRLSHQKKVRSWFMNPEKFKKEMDTEQQKHVGKCIYHLCDNHSTLNCNVKKDCEKLLTAKTSSSSSSAGNAHLRHITEELFEDAITSDTEDIVTSDALSNDTNEASLHYFACVTNHFLRLVKSSATVNPRHDMKYPIIADSGANYHMFRDTAFFDNIVPATGRVLLGDGKTTLAIEGIGTIKLKFGNNVISIDDVRYIPSLAESIYSLFLHIQSPDHAVHSSFEDGLNISFPDFSTKAIIGHTDIYLDAQPVLDSGTITFSGPTCSSSTNDSSDPLCRHISQFHSDVTSESAKVDNLLANLRRYYKEIKTKRQLNLEMPAGFRQENDLQRTLRDAKLYHLANESKDDTSQGHDNPCCPNVEHLSNILSSTSVTNTDDTVFTDNTSTHRVPILRCIDKVSSSLPSRLTLSEDFIRASMGF